jgi:hypothetical protein
MIAAVAAAMIVRFFMRSSLLFRELKTGDAALNS